MSKINKPQTLIILDGFGCGKMDDKFNAVVGACPENIMALRAKYPHTRLGCSGEDVGLPEGQMGNSEVGHLNMGAGRVVYQELTRISKAIRTGDFFQNPVLIKTIEDTKAAGGALHLCGLLSDGGVHSHISHVYALVELAKKLGQQKVYIHAFLDGRDVPPQSALEFIDALEAKLAEIGVGKIATISGRFYAMDRDKRWERLERAYSALVYREGDSAPTARSAVEQAYANDVVDEFVPPTIIESAREGGIKANDGVIFFNFRPDRAREITWAFVKPDFDGFKRRGGYFPLFYTCMTQYDESLTVPVAYRPQTLTDTFSEYISRLGYTQLRIAETEKYAHVTFFFDGGVEKKNTGEERILIPSPKVNTYDMQPSMSALEVTEKVIAEINAQKYDFIIINYANCDMVGHTGVFDAAVTAVKTVDQCVERVVAAVKANGGTALITADHGNADEMWDYANNCPHTAHTLNKVPLIIVDDELIGKSLREDGVLADIAPTMLKLANIEQPESMSGKPLL
ncbi:MAG: 2,3-bisphosphoglycerate-independent phosphoglycerate mutase [Negativicutes bacterium]|jgi:2,3-bisphosphoglycerate-independent phosphoglycerate mutase